VQTLWTAKALDSGLHFRLYDFVMATNHQATNATMQIGEVARRRR